MELQAQLDLLKAAGDASDTEDLAELKVKNISHQTPISCTTCTHIRNLFPDDVTQAIQ